MLRMFDKVKAIEKHTHTSRPKKKKETKKVRKKKNSVPKAIWKEKKKEKKEEKRPVERDSHLGFAIGMIKT